MKESAVNSVCIAGVEETQMTNHGSINNAVVDYVAENFFQQ